jgi:23S rRNA (adenine2503-C2)-methyltransferase
LTKANLLNFDRDALAVFCEQALGEKRYRATQLFRAVHQRGARDAGMVSDLAKSLRTRINDVAEVQPLKLLQEHVSSDGTIKWLFDVGAGDAVETVFIPETDRGRGLPLLLHRSPRLQPQLEHGRDRRAALAR